MENPTNPRRRRRRRTSPVLVFLILSGLIGGGLLLYRAQLFATGWVEQDGVIRFRNEDGH